MSPPTELSAEIGVFGGSGLYSLLDDHAEVTVDTPYGPPSGPLQVGVIGERRVAFLARHGPTHAYPPHRINYRANVWALHSLGVTRVLAPCASGSLQPDVKPGHFVVCDQLVDRTYGREQTYFDGPGAGHISFADPYCPQLREVAIDAVRAEGIEVHPTGTVVVIQGPRFSTRAESQWFGELGGHVVNMTQYPEAALTRELGICYAAIALITDYDAGVDGAEPVTQAEVFEFFEQNADRVRDVLGRAIVAMPVERACSCSDVPGDPPPPLSGTRRAGSIGRLPPERGRRARGGRGGGMAGDQGRGPRPLALGSAPRWWRGHRSRRARWILSVALAGGAAILVASLSARASQTLDAYGHLRPVAVARRDLEPGRRLTGGDVAWREVPRGLVPRDAVESSPVGRTVIDPLGPGEVITTRHLAPGGLVGVAALVTSGHRAVAVPVPAHGLDLHVGDEVDVIATGAEGDDRGGDPRDDPVVARRARVLAVDDGAVVVEVADAEVAPVAAAVAEGTPVLALRGAP